MVFEVTGGMKLNKKNAKPKIAILTSFINFSPAYSPTGIALDQARMLHRAGYEYDLLAIKNFYKKDGYQELAVLNPAWKDPELLNVKYSLAQVELHDYQPMDPPKPDFEKQVEELYSGNATGMGYAEALEPYDVIITHDLMFLSWHLSNNKALRKCVEKYPKKRWLHWCHSGAGCVTSSAYPSTLRYQGCPNSQYVFLNMRQRQDLANMMKITPHDVSVCYNTKDIRDLFEFSEDTCSLIDAGGLLEHEILQVYPFSTPRWEAKGIKQLMRIFGGWRKMNVNAKLVLINAHCTQEVDEQNVKKMMEYARTCGLTPDRDVIWTSRFAKAHEKMPNWDHFKPWLDSVPAKIVRELTLAANMFVFPSISECCSLIQAEAEVMGKFCVLNRDFPPMLEFGGDAVLHYELTRNDPDTNPTYFECVAREVWAHLQRDPIFVTTTMARTQTYNRDWIFMNQFEPMLYFGRL